MKKFEKTSFRSYLAKLYNIKLPYCYQTNPKTFLYNMQSPVSVQLFQDAHFPLPLIYVKTKKFTLD